MLKNAILLGIFLLILPKAFAGASLSQILEIDFRELKLEKSLIKSVEAEETLQPIVDKILDDVEGSGPYDEALIHNLRTFISQYRNTESALTAKLYLAGILLLPCYYYLKNESLFGKEPFKKIRDESLAIFQSIAREFPNTWQGKDASIISPERFALMLANDKDALISVMKTEIPLIQELDQDPQFNKYNETLYGTYGSVEEELRYYIISSLLDLKRWEEAKKEFEIFRVKFPQISWVEELANRIKNEAK